MLEAQQAPSNFVTPRWTAAKFGNSKKKKQYYNIFSKIDISILKAQVCRHCDVWYTICQFKRKKSHVFITKRRLLKTNILSVFGVTQWEEWKERRWGIFFSSCLSSFLLFDDINPKSLFHVDHTTLSFLHDFSLQTSFMPHELPCRKQSGPVVIWKIITEKLICIRPASSTLSSTHFRHSLNKTEVPWFNKCIG